MMKSRWFWLGLATLAVAVLATTFVCADSFLGNTSTIKALSAATAEHAKTSPTFPKATLVSEGISDLQKIVAKASQDTATDKSHIIVAALPELPPPLIQGDACIKGTLIDHLHRPLTGWTVHVKRQDGSDEKALTTDASGAFQTDGLGGGEWTVAVDLKEGWGYVTSPTFKVTLTGSGMRCAEVRFKNYPLPCVKGVKTDWKDGLGIVAWKITASKGTTTLTATTNGLGQFEFRNLTIGRWTFREEDPPNWDPVKPSNGQHVLDLAPPSQPGICHEITFVNKQVPTPTPTRTFTPTPTFTHTPTFTPTPMPSPTPTPTPTPSTCIKGLVINNDYVGIGGFTVTARRSGQQSPERTTQTDADGNFDFYGLTFETWIVAVDLPAGWTPISPITTEMQVPLTRGSPDCEIVRFKIQSEPAGVSGHKRDENDQLLGGWVIKAKPVTSNAPILETTTNADGFYQFATLDGREWKIWEDLEKHTGWMNLTSSSVVVKLGSDGVGSSAVVDFQNHSPRVCVDVYVYDGFDPQHKVGLPDWTLTVQSVGDDTWQQDVTDGIGHARFQNMLPGTYRITLLPVTNWRFTNPWNGQMVVRLDPQPVGIDCPVKEFDVVQTAADPPGDPTSCRTTHTVKGSETLYAIATRYSTTVAAIKRANGLSSNNIYVGQKLCIP